MRFEERGVEKIKAIFEEVEAKYPQLLKRAKNIEVKTFFVGFFGIAKAKSSNDKNKVYEIVIDVDREVFMCSCPSWLMNQYTITSEKFSFRSEITVCKHILAVLKKIEEEAWEVTKQTVSAKQY